MSDRFYTNELLGPGEFTLAGPEAHHIATVRRYSPGDHITLFNGDGNEYLAEVVVIDRKRVGLNVLSAVRVNCELPFELCVASALPKGDRADYLIEKLTELGVTRFVPLVTARIVVVPKANAVEKLTRAVIEASKQCGRNRLMVIEPPRVWAEFVRRSEPMGARFVLHTGMGWPTIARGVGGAAIAVGPEGGFTDAEIDAAVAAGWQLASLGPRVLRVETAAVAAATLLGAAVPC